MLAYTALATSAVLCILLYALIPKRFVSRYPLPPGPKTSWFGKVGGLPVSHPWITYASWKERYGELIYIYAFGNPVLVLNTARVATDLLDKRSAIYSSRPHRTMVTDLMGWDWLFSTIPYGSWWRKHRALFHKYFNTQSTHLYHPVVRRETQVFLRNLVDAPEKFAHHVRRHAAAIVMRVSYGHEVAPEGDPYVTLADEALTSLGQAGIFGTFLVDYIPPMAYIPSWMPGAGWKRQAYKWRKICRDFVDKPFQMVKERMASGTAKPCIAVTGLEEIAQHRGDSEQETLTKDVAAIAYAAGADTTVSAILSFFLACTIFPEVLEKAQAQIAQVVGQDRLPTLEDRPSLPYIDWIIWECLRWNPVTPLGVAHSLIEDDVYEGKFIPKNTTVIANQWAILHDEKSYPNPTRFWPDRYADQKNKNALETNEIPWAAFGFGRRMCPGRWMAIDTVWITIASVITVFDISKALDDKGSPIEPVVEYHSSLLSHPKDFRCRILPRSAAALALIQQAPMNAD